MQQAATAIILTSFYKHPKAEVKFMAEAPMSMAAVKMFIAEAPMSMAAVKMFMAEASV